MSEAAPGSDAAAQRPPIQWGVDSIAAAIARPLTLVLSAAAAWSVVLIAVAVDRPETIRSHRFDLGNMVQAVWNTAHGRPLEVTLASGEQMSRLGVHVDPILVGFAPFAWFFSAAYVLIVAQVIALATGAVAVYLLGRRHLESEAASVLLSVAYLLYPSIAWNALSDFHPVTLAIPLLLWAIWFLDADRLVSFAVLAGLALLTNELIGLGVGALGLWYAFSRGRRRAGLIVAAVGFSWTVVCLKVIVPAFSGRSSPFYDRFSSVGGSPEGMAKSLFTDPSALFGAVTTFHDGRYVLALLTPLLGLWLWSPLALAALPQLGINLTADWDSAVLPQYQYVAGIVPYLFAASCFGLKRYRPRVRPYVASCVVLLTGLIFVSLLPRPGRDPYIYYPRESAEHVASIRAALALVPDGARVSTTSRMGGQISDRRYVYSFPVRQHAEWIVVDENDPWLPIAGELPDERLHRRELANLRRDSRFRLVFARDDVAVYRRAD
jgi:uncharacterized membrane protein